LQVAALTQFNRSRRQFGDIAGNPVLVWRWSQHCHAGRVISKKQKWRKCPWLG